jgi:CRISPR-associated endonuclease/helicase Cas3
MGEGKTEAAFFAYLELQRSLGNRGLYVALPTKATGNAMFVRTLKFFQRLGAGRKLDLQLLHGATLLNDTFQNLRLSGICDQEYGGEIRAGEWFANKKRALLSEYGVGTVDQPCFPFYLCGTTLYVFGGLPTVLLSSTKSMHMMHIPERFLSICCDGYWPSGLQ